MIAKVAPIFLETDPASNAASVRLGRLAATARALSDVSTPLSINAATIRRACRRMRCLFVDPERIHR